MEFNLYCSETRLGGGIESPILIFCAICISRVCPIASAFSTIESSTYCINSSSAVFSKQTRIEGWAMVEEPRNENRNKPWTKASGEVL